MRGVACSHWSAAARDEVRSLLIDLHHRTDLLVVEVEIVTLAGVILDGSDQFLLIGTAEFDTAIAANDLEDLAGLRAHGAPPCI